MYGEGADPKTPSEWAPNVSDAFRLVNGNTTYAELRSEYATAAEDKIRSQVADVYPLF